MEGSKCPFVCGVDARVVLDKQGSYVHVLDIREEVEVKKREGEEAVMMDPEMKIRQKMKEEESGGEKRGW